MSEHPLVTRVTAEECRQRIVELETEAGKSTDELRAMRMTWSMTVRQRDILSEIDHVYLLSGD